MRQPRDYKAEYAKRNALAKSRGFKSYGQQRRAIEKGTVRAIAPGRVRSKRTLDAQQAFSFREIIPGFDLQETRIESAQRWSDRNARSNLIKFDAKRARKDKEYLDRYMVALVLSPERTEHYRRLTPSPALKSFLVDFMHIIQANEYETRYGEGYPHGGQFNRTTRAGYRARRKTT